MNRDNIKKSNYMLTSETGAGVLLFVFLLIPIVFLVPAIALDLSAYQATKVQLQNALEISSDSALNKSILDNYRSDKIIKLKDRDPVTNRSYYATRLSEEVSKNFNTTATLVNDSKIDFTPGYPFTPNTAKLIISYGSTQSAVDTVNNGVSIELQLTSSLKLPVASKLLSLVGIDDGSGWSPSITITDRVNGIRVLNADDFGTYDWQNKLKE